MDVVIIGAGASGLVAAIESARRKNNVTIIEKLETSAKKILATGNGKCNYWNENFDNKFFNSENNEFIKEVNTQENQKEVLQFFEKIGITPFIKNGYYYPMSMQASSIRNALLLEAMKQGVKILNNSLVSDVKLVGNKFKIEFTTGEIYAEKLIIATGSNAYYKDRNLGYDICKKLGHNIIKVMPALVQLTGSENFFKDWAGVRSNVSVKISVNNKIIKQEFGEIMLTDYGISGICVFNLSGIANKALDKKQNVKININFLPHIDDLSAYLENRNKDLYNRNLEEFLEGILNYKLINVILKKSNISKKRKWADLNEMEKSILCSNISNFELEVSGSKSFENAQVCTGGVDTKEINPHTMESKICKNLYIIGEILDVDGCCGGYNLGFAWLSGMIAGRSVGND